MRVAIVATGVMELEGLAGCLGRLFPRHDFQTVPQRAARPGQRAEPFSQCFTCRQRPGVTSELPRNLTKVIQELAGQVYPRRRDAVDFSVVIDDLELFNADQPEVVVGAIREAVRGHLDRAVEGPIERAALAACLRERVSFHLAVPMTEAWFFSGGQSLAPNGVPGERQPRLRAGADAELLETDDPEYTADDGAQCVQMADRNRRRGESRRAPWMLAPQPDVPWFTRERHPKAYLQWLCRNPTENSCTTWRETEPGAAALRALDWAAVLEDPSHCAYARALLDDLADALGEPPPFPQGGMIAPLTARKPPSAGALLRNL
ncbi:MAG: hypothetical protein ABI193_00685 [Minicystis sp.]